ncbi:MAG: HD-GYP domain-containing protein [Bacillota bacterium]|nr:HD-GYP domain-containing protein [Bacillota bacterium]
MLFVPTEFLKAGMVLAVNIENGVYNIPLLSQGQVLTNKFIKRIKELNISGVYIENKLFDDVVIKDIVDVKLKNRILTNLKDIYEDFSKTTFITNINLNTISDLAKKLVDNILSEEDVLINLSELKGYDDYTYRHSLSVAVLSITIGLKLGCNQRVLSDIATSALLHDVGKMKIDISILNKPSKLTAEEFEIIKQHPSAAYELLNKNRIIPTGVLNGIVSHHEKFDGTGYPKGLKDKEIPLYAKILAVADVYDALTSNRPYRKACFPNEAVEYMMANSGIQFNHQILEAFLKSVAAYPVGSPIALSNGMTAIIVKNHPENTLRPIIRIIEENGEGFLDVDLLYDKRFINVTIVGRDNEASFFDLLDRKLKTEKKNESPA